jgi:hypothetical protein
MGIASHVEGDVDIVDVLRWNKNWSERDSTAGSPGPAELVANLTLIRKVAWDRPAVLVGYLATSAAKVQACAAALRASGARVLLALFAGRIVSQSPADPFAVMRAEVPDI